MIKKLRIKFVLVAMASVAVMLFAVLFSVNLFNFVDLDNKTDAMLTLIKENNGILPKPDKREKPPHNLNDLPREAMFDTRYFVVYLAPNNEILYTDTGNIYATSSQMAQEYSLDILNKNKTSGYIDDYKYLVTTFKDSSAIIFVDASRDIRMFKGFLYNSSIISFIALTLVAIVSYFLSPFAVKPIAQAYEKQKEFITNASHEIKTPLTVISANIDIMEMHTGENKWTSSSKEQIIKLTDLVNSLVSLSRMEENEELRKANFSLSEVAEMVIESYNNIALTKNKKFNANIESNINYIGNEKNISQLFYILLDNAFKYSNDNGVIDISLSKNQDKIILIIQNTVDQMPVGKHNELFDRFYRKDESRNSQTSGFGIGLSLAKSIVAKHKGKIIAKSIDGKSLTIEVIL